MTNSKELLSQADSHFAQGQFEEAETLCREILLAGPKNKKALALFGRLQLRPPSTRNSRQTASKFAHSASVPETPAAPSPNAAAFKGSGPGSSVLQSASGYRQDYKIDLGHIPDSIDQQLQLAALLEEQQGWREAEQIYLDLLHQPERGPEVLMALAKNRRQQGKQEAALATLRRCLEDYPDYIEAYCQLTDLLETDQQWDQARQVYLQALVRDENSASLTLGLARTLVQLGRSADALLVFERSCGLAPDWMPALEAYCQALLDDGQAEQAWCQADRACLKPGASAGMFDFLGRASQVLQHPSEDCVRAAFSALQRDPHRVSIYSRLAPLLRDLDREAEAALLYDFSQLLYWRPQSQAAGYLVLDDFHADLRPLVQARPQSSEDLLNQRVAAIQSLELLLEQGAKEYLQLLTGLPGHPYLIKPPSPWRLSAKSLVIKASDYRVPTVDPGGYLSGYYFVQVPKEVSQGEGEAGCLRFFDGSDHEEAMRFETLRPKEGLLVLFPSYFWCGTIPFAAKEPLLGLAITLARKPRNTKLIQ